MCFAPRCPVIPTHTIISSTHTNTTIYHSIKHRKPQRTMRRNSDIYIMAWLAAFILANLLFLLGIRKVIQQAGDLKDPDGITLMRLGFGAFFVSGLLMVSVVGAFSYVYGRRRNARTFLV